MTEMLSTPTCLSEQTPCKSSQGDKLPDGPRINIGSGPHNPAGWVNVDGSWQVLLAGRPLLARLAHLLTRTRVGYWPVGILYRDIRRGLRLADNSVAAVYSSHTLEHLYREEALGLLKEIHTALKSGGVCRIVVPDVRAIIQWYLDHQKLPLSEKLQSSSDVLMGMLHVRQQQNTSRGLLSFYRRWTDFDHHKWMYDEEGLVALLKGAGFAQPGRRDFLQSSIPRAALEAVEKADRVCDNAGVCVEARK